MTDQPKRIRLRRTRGWRKPPGAIVVARPTKWGNPYTLNEMKLVYPGDTPAELRAKIVSDLRGLIEGRWDRHEGRHSSSYPSVDEIVAELAGHDLACWCPDDQDCHASLLLAIANGHEWKSQ